MLTLGDLFSGIGGFSLGLERAGMRTRWFAEIEPYASAVLRKHWPDIPNHGDVRNIRAGTVEPVDVICGGFPCQDISNAGKRAGIDGERSGLWSEYARVVGELRPRYVIVENVAALLGRGIERVLGDLAALGFDAEWHCIPASAVGAPHRRDRVWIVAHSGRAERRPLSSACDGVARQECLPQRQESTGWFGSGGPHVADADEFARNQGRTSDAAQRIGRRHVDRGGIGAHVADADGRGFSRERIAQHGDEQSESGREPDGCSARGRWPGANGADTIGARLERLIEGRTAPETVDGPGDGSAAGWWSAEPDVGRVAHGVPSRVDRLRCLGNALVPQVAEIIGRAVMEHAQE